MIQTKELTQLERFLPLIYDLQKETWPHDHLSKKDVFEKIIQLAQILGVNLSPNDPEFLPIMILKIKEISFQPPEQEAPSIPPNLSKLLEDYDGAKKEQEEEIKKKVGSQENYSHYQKLENGLKKFIVVSTDSKIPEELAKRIAESAVDKIITSLPPVAQPEFFPEEDKEQILKEAKEIVDKEVKKVIREEVVLKKEALDEFKKIIEAEAIKIAATPQIIRPFQEATKKETIVPSPISSLPKEILVKLNQPPEEVNFLPFYTVLQPKVAAAFMEKVIYTLPAKFLSLTAEDASPEWRAMMQKGLFVEDIQASIKALKAMGVPETYPLLKKLSDKEAHLQEQQKFTIQTKDGQIIYKDTLAARIFKHYRHFDKITGRQKIYDEDLKTNLPRLSPDLAWSQGGYAGFLRNSLNRFKFVINTYERISKFVTKGKYTSFLTPVRQFFSRKITQPVIRWLAKTAAGKAVQQGAKKAATWIAAKLGVKLAVTTGVAAAGAATGPPGWVVAAVTIGLDILKTLGRKIIGFVRRIIQEPDKALGSVGVGVLLLVFAPMPFALIGILPIALGGIGLVSFTLAPATLTTISGGIGAFFTTLTTLPFTLPIALFVIILLSVLAGLTLFIVMVVSGAFILPSKVAEVTPTTISPYYSEYFTLTKTALPTHLEPQEVGLKEIEYTVTITAKDKKITINSLNETISIQAAENKNLNMAPHDFTQDLTDNGNSVLSGQSLTIKYRIKPPAFFNDSAIINTVSASIGVEGVSGNHPAVASAVVTLGNPPLECPLIWPTPRGYITQGPNACYSHTGQEAIDIGGVGENTPVLATHQGTVKYIGYQSIGGGYYVRVEGYCRGQIFSSYYYHLKAGSTMVKVNDKVVTGQQIAITDCSGMNRCENHLHYEFKEGNVRMIAPDVPITIPRGCSQTCGISCNNIRW